MKINFPVNKHIFIQSLYPSNLFWEPVGGKRNHRKFTFSTLQSQTRTGHWVLAPGWWYSHRERGSYIHTQVLAVGCGSSILCSCNQLLPSAEPAHLYMYLQKVYKTMKFPPLLVSFVYHHKPRRAVFTVTAVLVQLRWILGAAWGQDLEPECLLFQRFQ